MFERKDERLAPALVFLWRLAASVGVAGLLAGFALFVGVAG